jgi:hypothetical protein
LGRPESSRSSGRLSRGNSQVLEQKNNPVYDELTLARLLEAAYVVQEHNRKLQALGLRVLPLEEDERNQKLPGAAPAVNAANGEGPAAPEGRSSPAPPDGASAAPSEEDYTRTLARIVETQHQIQMRALDLDNVLATVVQRVTVIARAGGAAIGMLHDGKIRYKAASASMAPSSAEEIPAEKAPCAAALRGGIIRCLDVESDAAVDLAECRRRGVHSMIAVPIYRLGGVVGALELYYGSKSGFTEQDVHTCQLMAGLVTEALARGEEPNWKESLASERSAMLQALEKLKPDLEALAGASAGEPIANSAHRSAASASSCRRCGNELLAEEQFCGQCGCPRSGDADRHAITAKRASFWPRQTPPPKNAAPVGVEISAQYQPEPMAGFNEKLPDQALADALEKEMPELFSAFGPDPEPAPTPTVDTVPEAVPEPTTEPAAPEAPLAQPNQSHGMAWTSAAATREFLEQLAATKSSSAVARFWNARRGDFYLAFAVFLVACVIRWGIWSNHPVSATAKAPAAAGAQQKPAPDADLSLFDRILIKLGLAVPPETPESKGNPDTQVWVDLHTGLYYCPGTDLYGKTPKGKMTTQRDAQLDQYEPAYRKACE